MLFFEKLSTNSNSMAEAICINFLVRAQQEDLSYDDFSMVGETPTMSRASSLRMTKRDSSRLFRTMVYFQHNPYWHTEEPPLPPQALNTRLLNSLAKINNTNPYTSIPTANIGKGLDPLNAPSYNS
jgi:hypothetical protein